MFNISAEFNNKKYHFFTSGDTRCRMIINLMKNFIRLSWIWNNFLYHGLWWFRINTVQCIQLSQINSKFPTCSPLTKRNFFQQLINQIVALIENQWLKLIRRFETWHFYCRSSENQFKLRNKQKKKCCEAIEIGFSFEVNKNKFGVKFNRDA